MINKTRFFSLTIVILVIFIMFQFIGNSVDLLYNFNENVNAEYMPSFTQADNIGYSMYTCFYHNNGVAAIVTQNEDDIPGVTDACDYLKINYNYYQSLSELDYNSPEQYSLVVIGCYDIDLRTDIDILKTFLSNNVNVIFAVLPDLSVIKNEQVNASKMSLEERNNITELNNLRREMRRIIGTQSIYADEQKIAGITLFEGFLFGGKAIYEEVDPFTIPHFGLFASGKAYVMGILDDWEAGTEYRNERLPHIIWRNSYTGSYVFVVNADFMRHSTGIGFFVSMLSEMCDDFAYPVINAQTLMLENIPTLSAENTETLSKYYNQTMEYFFQTTVFPSVDSVVKQTGFLPTYFILSRYSYDNSNDSGDDIYKELLDFYQKQSRKQLGELGISGYDGGSSSQRLLKDLELFSRISPDYIFTVLHASDMPKEEYTQLLSECEALQSITTVIRSLKANGDIEKIEYVNDDVLVLPQTDNGYVQSDTDDMVLRSIMTALGCSYTGINGYDIVYPKDDTEWTTLAVDWARYLHTNWAPFDIFSKLTVSDADSRTRIYLSTNYQITTQGDTTYISASNFSGEGYIVLRTSNKKIIDATGCTYKKIEDGFFLLTLTSSNASVRTEKLEKVKYSDN